MPHTLPPPTVTFDEAFTKLLAFGLAQESERTTMRSGWLLREAYGPYKDCQGVPDTRCDYYSVCKQVCTKCGNVHNGHHKPVQTGAFKRLNTEESWGSDPNNPAPV
jgi:hypothetical protein